METSAKSKTMVDELFAEIVRQMNYAAQPDKDDPCCSACNIQQHPNMAAPDRIRLGSQATVTLSTALQFVGWVVCESTVHCNLQAGWPADASEYLWVP